MLCRELMAVYCKNHVNKLNRQKTEICVLQLVKHMVNTTFYRGKTRFE
jgi:hypothetical protein